MRVFDDMTQHKKIYAEEDTEEWEIAFMQII